MDNNFRNKTAKINYFQVRGYSSDLYMSFLFIKKYWRDVLLITLPLSLCIAIFDFVSSPLVFNESNTETFSILFPYIISTAAAYFMVMPATFAVIEYRRNNPDGALNLKKIVVMSANCIPQLALVIVPTLLMVFISAIFFIIPSIFTLVMAALTFPYVCIDTFRHGIKFNINPLLLGITNGSSYWGNNFMLIFLSQLISGTLILLPYIPFGLIIFLLAVFEIDASFLGDTAFSFLQPFGLKLTSFFFALSINATFVINSIPLAFRYYNLQEREENYGLMEKIIEVTVKRRL